VTGADWVLLLASVAGFLAVTAGAFGAHALKGIFGAEQMAVYSTAVQYHFWHSLALLGLGALWRCAGPTRWLVAAATCWVAGIVLFSGSLYLLSVTQLRWLGFVTPFGGVSLLAGWLLLGLDRAQAIRASR
jgi:uncharacterized membrane protein YgdD (TMEM256/DUF423 family)